MNNKESIPLSVLVEAQADIIGGLPPAQAAKRHGLRPKALEQATERVGLIMSSDSPLMSVERQIISEAITDRLKPIKEELALKSLEIIRKADQELSNRLSEPETLKTRDILSISDIHSKRLARITGMEEDPNAGGDDPNARTKNVNIFVKNIFKGHKDKLEKEREQVNDTTLTPVYEGEVTP